MSEELFKLLLQVVTSWQVIAVTIVIVLYMSLVSRVTRSQHRPRVSRAKPKKAKAPPAPGPEVVADGGSTNAELGLEEM